MLTLDRSWMRLVARSARIPVPRIVEAGLVTVTRTGDLASSSSGNMFSCSVLISVRRGSDGGLVAPASPARGTPLLRSGECRVGTEGGRPCGDRGAAGHKNK